MLPVSLEEGPQRCKQVEGFMVLPCRALCKWSECLVKPCCKAHNGLPSECAHTFPELAPIQRQLSQQGKLLSGALEECIILPPNTRVLIIHAVEHRAASTGTGALQAPSDLHSALDLRTPLQQVVLSRAVDSSSQPIITWPWSALAVSCKGEATRCCSMVSTRSGSVVAVGAQSAEVSSRRGGAAKSVPRTRAQGERVLACHCSVSRACLSRLFACQMKCHGRLCDACLCARASPGCGPLLIYLAWSLTLALLAAGGAKQGRHLRKKRADTAEEAVLLGSDQRAPQTALASVTEAPAGPADREDDAASSSGDEDESGPLAPRAPPASVAQASTRPSEPARDGAGAASCSSSDESGDEGSLPGLAQSMWAALRTGRVALGPALPAVPAPSSSGRVNPRAPGTIAAAAAVRKEKRGRAASRAAAGASDAGLARPEAVAGKEGSEPGGGFAEVSWDPQTGLPAPLLYAQTAALAAQPEPGLAKQVSF